RLRSGSGLRKWYITDAPLGISRNTWPTNPSRSFSIGGLCSDFRSKRRIFLASGRNRLGLLSSRSDRAPGQVAPYSRSLARSPFARRGPNPDPVQGSHG